MLSTVEDLLAGLGAGIEHTPGVCGGNPRIAGTRIPVGTLEQYRRLGVAEAKILEAFPGLRAADLVNAWSYVAAHADEVERQILENHVEDE
ncbi:MAG: DUF433 domain-containing protein [Isosphaeraceae bacterium]